MSRKLATLFVLALVLAFGAVGLVSAEESTSKINIVHGIPGADFDLDPALPVDIFVSDLGCALTGFAFGERVGPLDVPVGSYDITVSLADEVTPCGGQPVIELSGVPFGMGYYTVIAHRTGDGEPGAGDVLGLGITASLFNNAGTPISVGASRLQVHHTAFAPAVDAVVTRVYGNPAFPETVVPGFANGDQIDILRRFGPWDVALEVGGATVFGPTDLFLLRNTTTYVYAVGDFAGGTFQYLVFRDPGIYIQP